MRTGKLNIRRGSKVVEKPSDPPTLSLVPKPDYGSNEASSEADNAWIRDRLELVERLARLHSAGLLTVEEFIAEKALVLGRSEAGSAVSDGFDPTAARNVKGALKGPSLLGAVFNWKFLPIGLVAGLALSFGAQPQETIRFFDQALKLAGA